MNELLFLCSGNYYRSRFAEHYFNHLAVQRNLNWNATSRGMALYPENVGAISVYALEGLKSCGILVQGEPRFPAVVTEQDLHRATHIIAVKEAEHRAVIQQRFPAWVDRVEFWNIHDIDCARPTDALPQLQQKIAELVDRLRV